MLKKILYTLLGISIAIAGSVSAVNVSIPQATQVNQIPLGQSTGNYTPTLFGTVADVWEATKTRWASSSTDYWLTTKTTDNLTQGSTNKYWSDYLFVQNFVSNIASTTANWGGTWQTHAPAYFQTALGFTPISNALTKGNFLVGNDVGVAQATSSIFVSSKGNVGIGTTSPLAMLSVAGTVLANAFNATSTSATSTIAGGLNLGGNVFYDWFTQKLGIGTQNPTSKLSVTSLTPQVQVSYDTSNYANLTVTATGDLEVSATGQDMRFLDGNVSVCNGVACQTPTSSNFGITGNILAENDIEIGGNYTQTCPTGYIWIPGSAKQGTLPGFCVMKYEAKGSAGSVVSTATGLPYVSLSQTTARAQCEGLGQGYHLISEHEWMTIAENIAVTPINDLEATAGLQLATGHSDNGPGNALATTDGADPVVSGCNLRLPLSNVANAYSTTCQLRGAGAGGSTDADKGYYGTGQSYTGTWTSGGTNDSQMRTHVLSNGKVIWDFAGDVWEWSDAYVNSVWEKPVNATTTDSWIEYTAITDYATLNYARPHDSTLSASSNGIGLYLSGASAGARGFFRGGNWAVGSGDGVFALALNNAPSSTGTGLGFRCAR